MRDNLEEALRIYDYAVSYVEGAGLETEVNWQRSLDWEAFTEPDLLRQSAWVILCGGFRESTVRKIFDHISLCFCDWESASEILDSSEACAISALHVFKHKAKIEAILDVARIIKEAGFESIKRSIQMNPIAELQNFPYIGPITAAHLAKNLGLNVAKEDRHLVRLTK